MSTVSLALGLKQLAKQTIRHFNMGPSGSLHTLCFPEKKLPLTAAKSLLVKRPVLSNKDLIVERKKEGNYHQTYLCTV